MLMGEDIGRSLQARVGTFRKVRESPARDVGPPSIAQKEMDRLENLAVASI